MTAPVLPPWEFCVAAGCVLLLAGSWRAAPLRGVPRAGLLGAWALALLGGFAGAHVYYILVASPVPLAARGWSEWLDLPAGTAVQGGVIGGFAVLWAYARARGLSPWDVMDVLAPGGAAAQAAARLGCLEAGCCYGSPSPWAQRLTGLPLHPAPLYESVLLFALAWGLDRALRSGVPRGAACLGFVGGYGAIRLLTGFVRGDDAGRLVAGLSHSQYAGALMLAAAVLAWRRLRPNAA